MPSTASKRAEGRVGVIRFESRRDAVANPKGLGTSTVSRDEESRLRRDAWMA